jgi:Na+-driven multidrug efflux pump
LGATTQLLTGWLSGYPLMVRLAEAQGDESARLTASSILVAATMSVPLSGIVAVALDLLGHGEFIIPGVTWIVMWQLQQSTRRALIADLRQRAAIVGDVLSCFGQILLVGCLMSRSSPSLGQALYAMAFAFTLGAIIQILQLRLSVSGLYAPHRWIAEHAALTLPALAGSASSALRHYALLWWLAIVAGTAALASLQAALTIFGVLNPLLFGLANLIPQIAARAYDQGGRQAAWRAASPYLALAAPPVMFYLIAAVSFSDLLLGAFYGQSSPYLQLGHLFLELAVFTGAMISTELIIAYLLGIRETAVVLKVNLLGLLGLALVPPLFALLGPLEGTCFALAGCEIIRLVVAILNLSRLTGSRIGRPAKAHADFLLQERTKASL